MTDNTQATQQESYDLAYDILALEAVDREEMRQLVAEVIDFDRAATMARERNTRPSTGWVAVEDGLPEIDSGFILAAWDDGEISLWSSNKLARGKDYVTHWMPLPNPPAENETGEQG